MMSVRSGGTALRYRVVGCNESRESGDLETVETSRTTRDGSPWALRPARFSDTREALRALACHVVAQARTGRISLRPTGPRFGTPAFDDGTRVMVEGDRLIRNDEQTVIRIR
jgi:hypothetical protein